MGINYTADLPASRLRRRLRSPGAIAMRAFFALVRKSDGVVDVVKDDEKDDEKDDKDDQEDDDYADYFGDINNY